jgi:transcriptional regulator with XRE-family HTH domain
MSTSENNEISRLEEERRRLNFKLNEFAEKVGVSRHTQINYEKQRRKPDTEYLENAYGLGVDILYVVVGIRSNLKQDANSTRSVTSEINTDTYENLDQNSQLGSSDPTLEDKLGSGFTPKIYDPSAGSESARPPLLETISNKYNTDSDEGFSPSELGKAGEIWWKAVSSLNEHQRESILTLVFNHVIAKFIEMNKDRTSSKVKLTGLDSILKPFSNVKDGTKHK